LFVFCTGWVGLLCSLAAGFSTGALIFSGSFLGSSFLGSSFCSELAFFFSSAFFFLCSKYFVINLLKSFPEVAAR
jgi:hypothetical protein